MNVGVLVGVWVAVGGTGVAVGGTGVAVGGTGVDVADRRRVAVAVGVFVSVALLVGEAVGVWLG